jgi:endoglucanase
MKIKKSVLLTLAALSAPALAQTCQPSATTPYLNIGNSSWVVQSSASLNTGTTVSLGPQPFSGTWSWSGCGTSGTSREQTITLTGSCTATATHTNSCGAKTVQQHNFTVWPAMAANAGKYIMVDQFGYLPNAKKVAVLRRPVAGYDAGENYWPGQLQVVNSATGAVVYSFWPREWKNYEVDPSSGDMAWHFDFSHITTPGTYEIVDIDRNQRSARFDIADNIYRKLLIQAVRTFYLQRAGHDKAAHHVGPKWADGASHLGAGQDPQSRRFLDPNNASTARDLRGGWYDAGDLNKYTIWTSSYTQELLSAYVQNPTVFTDDFNIAESYNGIPDILDEVKWGLDWLVRMQNNDGSMLMLQGVSNVNASPPSLATGPSYYGDVGTSGTLAAAAAFADAAKIYGSLNNPALNTYAANLLTRARNAWNWAQANPNVVFRNIDPANGTVGLGAGQHEVDDEGRRQLRLQAAIKLFAATGEATYRNYVDANYTQAAMFSVWTLEGFGATDARGLLYYAQLSNATPSVATEIRNRYLDLQGRSDYPGWGAMDAQTDPYGAHISRYTWASNAVKANTGTLFTDEKYYGISRHTPAQVDEAALNYVHYLHGVNPFGKVYFSNMNGFGAENSVNGIWHTWFHDGTSWDDAQNSLYGPAPGFLVGGPAGDQWKWGGGACPGADGCGAPPLPPYQQPPQKSYRDFNGLFPDASWSVSENSNGYQVAYIRLLARFVK